MEKQKNVPALRFPEFPDEWSLDVLANLSEDGFSNGVFNDPKKVGSGYRLINVKDMFGGDVINPDRLTLIDLDEKEFLKNRVQFGDILFTRSSLVKEGIAVSNVNLSDAEDITYDGHLIKMRPVQSRIQPMFLSYNLTTSNLRRQLILRGKTTTMTTIGQDDIATVIVKFPKLPEQQKIASFLTAVDDKLRQFSKKKALLEQYKKGVMQQLFSQKLRFKPDRASDGDDQGNEFPDWEEKTLGDLGEIVTGKTPSTNDTELWGGDIQFITPTDILPNNKYQESTARTVSKSKGMKVLPEKSILFTCIASIGKMALSVKPCITNQQINSVIPISSYSNEFVYYAILHITEYIKSTKANTTLPIINKTEFSKIRIQVPSFSEQIHIANFLSVLDDKINGVNQQIEQTRQFKKGLLQQMFV